MLLTIANAKDLGDAIAFAVAAMIAGAFCVGSALDIADAQRAGDGHVS